MSMSKEHSPAAEYEALREELLIGKKYVFERPLLIVTITVAAANFADKEHIGYLPPIVIGLMAFNLWFTVNRMQSMARIVAYVQIELEEKRWEPWLGWETCLRHYRLWINRNHQTQDSLVNSRFDDDVIPDAIGYYPMIFWMHFGVVALLIGVSIHSTFLRLDATHPALFLLTIVVSCVFARAAYKWRPRRCKNLIEEKRIRWELVFEALEGKKIRTSRSARSSS